MGGFAESTFDGRSLLSRDPATDEVIGETPVASSEEIAAAVRSARGAQPDWAALPIERRCAILARAADLLDARAEEMARLMTREQGKVIVESRAEVKDAANRIRYYASNAPAFLAPRIERARGVNAEITYAPIGLVGALMPWNFPVSIPLWTIAPALAAGNAVLCKPSEQTPLLAAQLVAILVEAGVPGEILPVLQGADETGKALVAAAVEMITLVGSQAAGRSVMASAGADLKRVTLELGGKDPMLVLEDADLEAAAAGAVAGAFRNCGQVCCSIERAYVARSLYDRFVESVVEKAKNLRIGPGLDEANQVGPMVAASERTRVLTMIADAVTRGAQLLVGGRAIEGPGCFVEPAVLVEVPDSAAMATRETFGPALTIEPFEREEEAVERANALPFGLTASVWSRNIERAADVAQRLEAGTRAVNMTIGSLVQMPWGGRKKSGIGRMLSIEGIREFAEPVVLRLPES